MNDKGRTPGQRKSLFSFRKTTSTPPLLYSFPQTHRPDHPSHLSTEKPDSPLPGGDDEMHYKVGTPYNVKHSIHVDFNSATGFQVPFLSPLLLHKNAKKTVRSLHNKKQFVIS